MPPQPRQTPPWTEFLTRACENITLPRAVDIDAKGFTHDNIIPATECYP